MCCWSRALLIEDLWSRSLNFYEPRQPRRALFGTSRALDWFVWGLQSRSLNCLEPPEPEPDLFGTSGAEAGASTIWGRRSRNCFGPQEPEPELFGSCRPWAMTILVPKTTYIMLWQTINNAILFVAAVVCYSLEFWKFIFACTSMSWNFIGAGAAS